MAIFEKMHAAIANRDTEAYVHLYGDDAVFVRHQTGKNMNKAQFADLIRDDGLGKDDMGERRCTYENDDILVVHPSMTTPTARARRC